MAARAQRKRVHGRTPQRSRPSRTPLLEMQLDPVESAEAAGLRYVSDMTPGIRRRKAGRSFSYVGADGKTIKNPAELNRIRSLAIPPAYTDVWICPIPNGHIQATGRDARRRKQYRYHARWREVRDETKFGRVLAFCEVLPRIRRRVESDLGKQGLPREKVLATVVRLLDCTGIRIGNDEYARSNRSFGLTTLRDRHVEISGSNIRFEFRGKSGKAYNVSLNDRRLARIVLRCQALPGEDLFQYLDDGGVRQTVGSGDVNDYLRTISGEEFTAKDFRTWAGTKLAVAALTEIGAWTSLGRQSRTSCARSIGLPNSSTTPGPCAASTTFIQPYLIAIRPARCSRPCRMERAGQEKLSSTPTKLRWQGSSVTSWAPQSTPRRIRELPPRPSGTPVAGP
jgi:DNA topoisomerase-1